MVGICDANNFYISCERVFNPALNGRPAVVLSNNDRCIIARSNEAKAIGLKNGPTDLSGAGHASHLQRGVVLSGIFRCIRICPTGCRQY